MNKLRDDFWLCQNYSNIVTLNKISLVFFMCFRGFAFFNKHFNYLDLFRDIPILKEGISETGFSCWGRREKHKFIRSLFIC